MSRPPVPARVLASALALALAACAAPGAGPAREEVAPDADASEIRTTEDGRCFGRTIRPATIETVTEQVLETPAVLDETGQQTAPARFRTVTRQRIVEPRRAQEFEVVCPAELTPDFIATLQRALIARQLMTGPVTYSLDAGTRAALRQVQSAGAGIDSAILARATAVELGIVPLRPEEIDRLSGG